MKKYLIYFALLNVFAAVFCGCRYNGPSDKEVFDAMEAVMRGFEDSMAQDTLEINNEYANAADGVFRSEDDSVVTNMTVLMNEGVFHVYGNCLFSDYQDDGSSYLLNGELIYNVKFNGSFHAEAGFGEMSCSVELAGGQIETLEFSFIIGERGKLEEFLVTANDMDITVKKENSFYDLFRKWSQTMPG
jgi:hypothetical protein